MPNFSPPEWVMIIGIVPLLVFAVYMALAFYPSNPPPLPPRALPFPRNARREEYGYRPQHSTEGPTRNVAGIHSRNLRTAYFDGLNLNEHPNERFPQR